MYTKKKEYATEERKKGTDFVVLIYHPQFHCLVLVFYERKKKCHELSIEKERMKERIREIETLRRIT